MSPAPSIRRALPRLLFTAALAAGCSGGSTADPPSFRGDALATMSSESGKLRVAVRTSPQPPTRGVNAVELTFTDAAGAPRDGLSLKVVPWMTTMGHGTTEVPAVAVQGQGKYVVTNVSFFMAGHWELRTTISEGTEDRVTPAFDIP